MDHEFLMWLRRFLWVQVVWNLLVCVWIWLPTTSKVNTDHAARIEQLEERAAKQQQRIADLQTRLVVDALRRGEPAVIENAWGPDGK